jgi:excisionase family DNA binding protein
VRTKAAENGLPVLLVRPEDAARALGIGRTKVYELIRSGALRSVRVGGLAGWRARRDSNPQPPDP